MSEATFTFRVDDTLKAQFMQAAKAADRSGAQLLRDFMRDYTKQPTDNNAAEQAYFAWVEKKVQKGLADIAAGKVYSTDDMLQQVHAQMRQAANKTA
ncbi:CopG family ribbon-helix-helix protein [Stenoxybacter acetivorans]|uniref:CopG family ribbon-helix-helix protein n=1 Tax=Stenoxybacter acetivorans TaxID=422441 RepID=UPI000562D06D|nr:hypothetical protein [Stenoxybacter acetivorans]